MRVMFAALLAAALHLGAAAADCTSPDDVVVTMSERFPDASLHSGPLNAGEHVFYAWSAPGVATLLVFAFAAEGGCLVEVFEVSPQALFGLVS